MKMGRVVLEFGLTVDLDNPEMLDRAKRMFLEDLQSLAASYELEQYLGTVEDASLTPADIEEYLRRDPEDEDADPADGGCPCCGEDGEDNEDTCPYCGVEMKFQDNNCLFCANAIHHDDHSVSRSNVCGECENHSKWVKYEGVGTKDKFPPAGGEKE